MNQYLLCIVLSAFLVPAVSCAQEFDVEFATLIGGSEQEAFREVIVLPSGSILVGGGSTSDDYPTTSGAFQTTYAGEPAGTGHPGVVGGDMILSVFSPDGRQLEASTYFGGSKQERNTYSLKLDSTGNIVFSSATRSLDLPTTSGAYQQTYGGGSADMMVAKISPDLTQLIWSTYFGGSGEDWNRAGFDLDENDNVVLAGRTTTGGFSSPGAFDASNGGWDIAIAKLSADGSQRIFSSRFGGSGNEAVPSVKVDSQGNIQFFGHSWSSNLPVVNPFQATNGSPTGGVDSIFGTLSADGSQLLQLSFMGGAGSDFGEHPQLLRLDGSNILVGFTDSSDFPVTSGAYDETLNASGDAYIAKLSPDGQALEFSTYFGGSGSDQFLSPVEDAYGNIYFVGETSSPDLPVTPNAIQSQFGGGTDGYLGVLNSSGSQLLYGTYLGGSSNEIIRSVRVEPDGSVYLVGRTSSVNFPTTEGVYQTNLAGAYDAFLVKLRPVIQFASSMTINEGVLATGSRESTFASDDADVSIQRNRLDVAGVVSVDFKSRTTVVNPSTVELFLESSVFARTRIVQSISLFDFVNSQYVELDNRDATRFVDQIVVASGVGELTRFVEKGTGCVKARVTFTSPIQRQLFSAAIDHIFWRVR